jgi:hypothetical protein
MSGFTIQCTTTGASESVTLPLVTGYNYDCTVDWDDGAPVSVTAWDDANATHVYVTPGTYTVEITGTCEAWSINNTHSSKLQWTQIVSFGDVVDFDGFLDLTGAFYGCTNLTGSIPSLAASTGLTSLFKAFRQCTGLTGSIPSLSANTNLTTLQTAFFYCTGLTGSIPSLSANTALAYMQYAFFNCTGLTGSIPSLSANTALVSLYRTFMNCTGLTGSIPSLSANTALTDVSLAFYGCTGLRIDPWMFYDDGEQSTKFLNRTVDFTQCFERGSCSADQGQAPDLWNCDFGTGSATATNCFAGAGNDLTSLINYNNIPAAWGGTGYVDTPPEITSVDSDIYNGLTITIDGTDFESSGGAVYICDTNDLSDTTKVSQTVTSQSDTEILARVTGVSGPGAKYVYVVDSDDQISDSPYAVTFSDEHLSIGNNTTLDDAYDGTIKKVCLCGRKLEHGEIRAINLGMLKDREF